MEGEGEGEEGDGGGGGGRRGGHVAQLQLGSQLASALPRVRDRVVVRKFDIVSRHVLISWCQRLLPPIQMLA